MGPVSAIFFFPLTCDVSFVCTFLLPTIFQVAKSNSTRPLEISSDATSSGKPSHAPSLHTMFPCAIYPDPLQLLAQAVSPSLSELQRMAESKIMHICVAHSH